jgi:VIT1/CCC1 family predicted Fe2+/Mn2+ transporter
MVRKISYWVSTGIVVALTLPSVMYLTGSPQVVEGFNHLGYPQHLRIILGIAKLTGAIILIVPGLRVPKEWAYAGFAFAWVIAFIAHWLAGDGLSSFTPLVLLALLIVSYLTRPPSRRLTPSAVAA